MRTTSRRAVPAAAMLLVWVGLWAGRADGQAGYLITDLGALGGSAGFGADINAFGHVAGYAIVPGGTHAFLWRPGQGAIDLGTLPGGDISVSTGITDNDVVVGYASDDVAASRAVRWYAALGHFEPIGTFGGTSTALATGFDGSLTVGYSYLNTMFSSPVHAVRFGEGGMLFDYNSLLPSNQSNARGVNDAGDAVGDALIAGAGQEAVLWRAGGGVLRLPTLGSGTVAANDISNTGRIVGVLLQGTAAAPFLWTGAGGARLLNGALPGEIEAWAYRINDAEVVVGNARVGPSAVRPYVWTAATGKVDLNTLLPAATAWTLDDARSINNAGQITGSGLLGGARRAYLLTPNPCRADWDRTGEVNANDLSGYLNAWFADIIGGTAAADFDGSGETNANDISAYINGWYAELIGGC